MVQLHKVVNVCLAVELPSLSVKEIVLAHGQSALFLFPLYKSFFSGAFTVTPVSCVF